MERTGWTYRDVEGRLVEAMELWHRTPGDGRWPFAADGPWHLVRPDPDSEADRAELILNAARSGRAAVEPPKRLPLSMAEVELRDRVSEWIRLAPERDRKLVAMVLDHKARSDKPVRWSRLRERLIRAGEPPITARGLGARYSRAITAIARGLEAADFRGDGPSSAMARAAENFGCSPLPSETVSER